MAKRELVKGTVRGFLPPTVATSEELRRLLGMALDRLTFAEQRDTIIDRAMQDACVSEIPDSPGRAAAFIFGAFRNAVQAALGAQAADTVVSSLGPMIRRQCAEEQDPEAPTTTTERPAISTV